MPIAETQRLIRKTTALGTIREKELPNEHIGISTIAPFLDVQSDDVIFNYIRNTAQETLAPARAQDAESRLRQSDEYLYGTGRASLVDWAFKNKYTMGDVANYRDNLQAQQAVTSLNVMNNLPGRMVTQFQERLARDDNSRKRALDNRLEWLIMTGLDTALITYNDGHVIFSVNFQRPSDQHNQAVGTYWDAGVDHDPIGDLRDMNDAFYDRYKFRLKSALISTKAIQQIWKSNRFLQVIPGYPIVGGTPNVTLDPAYLNPAWDDQAAIAVVERATGIKFRIYDGFYQTRPSGSTTITSNRFTNEKNIIFLPDMADLAEIDNTEIGFAKTLTSPHVEGNWQSGFYEWEDETSDPWMHVRGNGIKAFPVFPYLKYTWTLRVLA